jgi:2-haloacid dehalogenase
MQRMADPSLAGFEVLTLDCYGTLIDWETGILSSLGGVVRAHRPEASDDSVLEAFARAEAAAESGAYAPYRVVLRKVVEGVGERFGFAPTRAESACLEDSLAHWPPFPDTAPSLRALARRYRLGVISNVDNDLFALTSRALGVEFEWVVTAEDVGAYKPSRLNFERAIERIGEPQSRILHVAQSVYHDIVPAREIGLATVWVDRRGGRGFGATPPATAEPSLRVRNLEELVRAAGLG